MAEANTGGRIHPAPALPSKDQGVRPLSSSSATGHGHVVALSPLGPTTPSNPTHPNQKNQPKPGAPYTQIKNEPTETQNQRRQAADAVALQKACPQQLQQSKSQRPALAQRPHGLGMAWTRFGLSFDPARPRAKRGKEAKTSDSLT